MRQQVVGVVVLLVGCGGAVLATTPILDDAGTEAPADAPDETPLADATSDVGDAVVTSDVSEVAEVGDAAPAAWAVAEGRFDVLFRGPSVAIEASGRTTFVGHFEPALAFGLTTPCDGPLSLARVDVDGKGVFRRCFAELYEGKGLAVGPDGAIYLGTYALAREATRSARVRKLDAAGVTVWEKTFAPSAPSSNTMARTLDLAGSEVLLGGHTALATDFGKGLVGGLAVSTGVVARLSAATGATLWVRALGDCAGCGQTDVLGVAGSSTTTYLAGDWFGGPTNLGEGLVAADKGTFLAALDDKGGNRWVKQFTLNAPSLAVGPVGEVICAGSTPTAIDFGKGVTVSPGGYLVVFEPDGTPRWAATTGTPVSLSVVGGDVWVAGTKEEGGVAGAWLARLRVKDGAILAEGWPGRTAPTASQLIVGVAAQASGVAVVGRFASTIRFGTTVLTAPPNDGGVVGQPAFFARFVP